MDKIKTEPRSIGDTPLAEILNNKADYIKQVNKLKAIYESLEIGELTDLALTGIITCGTEEVLKEFKSQVIKEIEASGIKSGRMKEILMQGYTDAAIELKEAYKELLQAVADKRTELLSNRPIRVKLLLSQHHLDTQYSESKNPTKPRKYLTVGKNSWLSVTTGQSWSFEHSSIIIEPGRGDIYIYAKCPLDQSKPAVLVCYYQEFDNTNDSYLILIQSAPYDEIDYRPAEIIKGHIL